MDIHFEVLVSDAADILDSNPTDNQIWFEGLNIEELNILVNIINNSGNLSIACFPYFNDMQE